MLLTPPEILAPGQCSFDLPGGLDEVDRVVVVLLDARGDGQDVGVEDDVFRRKADLFGQQLVGPAADRSPCRRSRSPGPLRRRPSPPPRHRSGGPGRLGEETPLRRP